MSEVPASNSRHPSDFTRDEVARGRVREPQGTETCRTDFCIRVVAEARADVLAAMVASDRGTVISRDTVQTQIVTQIAITAAKKPQPRKNSTHPVPERVTGGAGVSDAKE